VLEVSKPGLIPEKGEHAMMYTSQSLMQSGYLQLPGQDDPPSLLTILVIKFGKTVLNPLHSKEDSHILPCSIVLSQAMNHTFNKLVRISRGLVENRSWLRPNRELREFQRAGTAKNAIPKEAHVEQQIC
jgi:hypothetical protein